MALVRYGKPLGNSFWSQKEAFLSPSRERCKKYIDSFSDLYSSQPLRTLCKNCENLLPEDAAFSKGNIRYKICTVCGHLNGAHQDTDEFCRALYSEDVSDYSKVYGSADKNNYFVRMNDVYAPKVDFLRDALNNFSENLAELCVADIGAGAGYFVSALKRAGVENSVGYEVSKKLIAQAQALGEIVLCEIDIKNVVHLASNIDADLVSLIGVLEHVPEPRKLLASIVENSRVRYVYMSLPLYSPAVFFESISDLVIPRHLTGGHTHLYTERSIAYFCDEFGLDVVGEWWFGLDVFDFIRSVAATLQEKDSGLLSAFMDLIKPAADDIQLALDRRKMSSEVHLLLKKSNQVR